MMDPLIGIQNAMENLTLDLKCQSLLKQYRRCISVPPDGTSEPPQFVPNTRMSPDLKANSNSALQPRLTPRCGTRMMNRGKPDGRVGNELTTVETQAEIHPVPSSRRRNNLKDSPHSKSSTTRIHNQNVDIIRTINPGSFSEELGPETLTSVTQQFSKPSGRGTPIPQLFQNSELSCPEITTSQVCEAHQESCDKQRTLPPRPQSCPTLNGWLQDQSELSVWEKEVPAYTDSQSGLFSSQEFHPVESKGTPSKSCQHERQQTNASASSPVKTSPNTSDSFSSGSINNSATSDYHSSVTCSPHELSRSAASDDYSSSSGNGSPRQYADIDAVDPSSGMHVHNNRKGQLNVSRSFHCHDAGNELYLKQCLRLRQPERVPWSEQEVLNVLREGRTKQYSSYITVEIMQHLDHLLWRPLARVTREARRFSHNTQRCTRHEIQSAMKVIFSRSLYDSCLAASMKAVTLYDMSGESYKQSKSQRCGIRFSVGKFHRWLIDVRVAFNVCETAAIFMAACLENLLEEVVMKVMSAEELGKVE